MSLHNRLPQVLNESVLDIKLKHRLLQWANEDLFASFLNSNLNKITAKLRGASEIEDQRDVGLELFVARIFLLSGCDVIYEPSKKGPDLLLELGYEKYYCEVRRIRENLPESATGILSFNPRDFRKIGDIICEKFLQLEILQPNLLYIRSNRLLIAKEYLHDAMRNLFNMADAGNSDFFIDKGFDGERDFLERASYCSAIVIEDLWSKKDEEELFESICLNRKAHVSVSPEMLEVIQKAIKIPFTAK